MSEKRIIHGDVEEFFDEEVKSEDIGNMFESNISIHNVFTSIEEILDTNVSIEYSNTNNIYTSDVLNLETHIERINAIKRETSTIKNTLSEILCGGNTSYDSIELIDEKIRTTLESGYGDNDSLYQLSRIMNIANKYCNSLNDQAKGILYSEMDVKSFTSSDDFCDYSVDAIFSVLSEQTINLKDQLISVNYISDNNLVNKSIIEMYNSMVSFNEIKNSEVKTKDIIMQGIKEKMNESFIETVKLMEYVDEQSRLFFETLEDKIYTVKDIFVK